MPLNGRKSPECYLESEGVARARVVVIDSSNCANDLLLDAPSYLHGLIKFVSVVSSRNQAHMNLDLSTCINKNKQVQKYIINRTKVRIF